MKTLRALVISAVVVLLLAAVAVKLYHHDDEVLQEVKDLVSQRMTDGCQSLVGQNGYEQVQGLHHRLFHQQEVCAPGHSRGQQLLPGPLQRDENQEVQREICPPLIKPETNRVEMMTVLKISSSPDPHLT